MECFVKNKQLPCTYYDSIIGTWFKINNGEMKMKKLSKKDKMLNTLICNVIVAKSDYEDKRITLETFKAIYKLSNSFVMQYLDDAAYTEFRNYHAVVAARNITQ